MENKNIPAEDGQSGNLSEEAANAEANEMLKDSVMEYFSSHSITLPTDVQSHLTEAFEDREFKGIGDDTVNIYFKEDADEFEKDYSIFKDVTVGYSGESKVETYDSYTYYGELDIGFAESVKAVDGDKDICEVESIPLEKPTHIVDRTQYVVCVLEKTTVSCSPDPAKRSVGEKTYLYIYCPISGEGIDD
jgi:hypothetical protein